MSFTAQIFQPILQEHKSSNFSLDIFPRNPSMLNLLCSLHIILTLSSPISYPTSNSADGVHAWYPGFENSYILKYKHLLNKFLDQCLKCMVASYGYRQYCYGLDVCGGGQWNSLS